MVVSGGPPGGFLAAVFDLDGTLLDTEEATCRYIASLLQPHGLEWTAQHHRQVVGTMRFFPARCLELLGVPSPRREELLRALPSRVSSPEYDRFLAANAGIKPGAARLIRRLQSRGLRLGLCTGRPADQLEPLLAARADVRALLEPLAARVVGSVDPRTGEKIPGKPDPRGYLVCAEMLGVEPTQCIVFEDAPSGVRSGKAAGAHTVVVPEAWVEGDPEAEEVFSMADDRVRSLADFDDGALLGPAAPLLLACGNPTVDLSCEVDADELSALGLDPGGEWHAGLGDDAKAKIVAFARSKAGVAASPGGAALNTARVAALGGGAAVRVAFLGAVGADAHGELLRCAAREAGVAALLKEVPGEDTGVVAVLVERRSRDRALAAVRGASAALDLAYLDEPSIAELIADASMLYLTAYVMTSQPRIAAVEELCARARRSGGAVAVNLASAGVLPRARETLLRVLPGCRLAFGNLAELSAFCSLKGWPRQPEEAASSPQGAALAWALVAAPRLAAELAEDGVAVITAGAGATVVAERGAAPRSFAVPELTAASVADTNGAGDAFAGGFLARLLAGGCGLEDCVEAGHACARLILQRSGCSTHGLEGQLRAAVAAVRRGA